jgi:hypothetical protein
MDARAGLKTPRAGLINGRVMEALVASAAIAYLLLKRKRLCVGTNPEVLAPRYGRKINGLVIQPGAGKRKEIRSRDREAGMAVSGWPAGCPNGQRKGAWLGAANRVPNTALTDFRTLKAVTAIHQRKTQGLCFPLLPKGHILASKGSSEAGQRPMSGGCGGGKSS